VDWATTPQPPRQHPLLVWVIFDELSYNQVFEHRARDLALPNFDALRNQSTVFSNVQPIGDKTVRVLPSLITGRAITAYNFTFDNRFMVHYDDTPGFQKLNPSDSIFADAQRHGWRTGVVGWYNPYCLIYAGTIDDCYWMNLDELDGPMAQRNSFWQNTWSPLRQAAQQVVSPARSSRSLCNFDVQHRYQTDIDLEQHSMQMLRTDQADLMMLHLPIPHSPNIWSRMKGGYTQQCDSSYLDNLALADRELGRILAQLESSPRWKDTTVIVQGDHSWRTYLWSNQPSWTAEDDAASRSGFDPRPAVIIHQAGQTTPLVNATAWSLVNVHAVIEQVLRGEPVHY
jgi:arylsulfatase A-like enzyme